MKSQGRDMTGVGTSNTPPSTVTSDAGVERSGERVEGDGPGELCDLCHDRLFGDTGCCRNPSCANVCGYCCPDADPGAVWDD